MKEATGEVSMTMVTIIAVAVIGAILAVLWGPITNYIENTFAGSGRSACVSAGGKWNAKTSSCDMSGATGKVR